MDSGNKHGDEVDIFEPAGARTAPVSSEEHIETETNVFFVDTLRQAAAQRGGGDSGAFEVSAPAQPADGASDGADFDISSSAPPADDDGDFEPPPSKHPATVDTADDDADGVGDPIDDDIPQKKGGFFAKLFRRGGADSETEEEDSDELSLDDDMFIAPPQVSGRTSASVVNQPAVDIVETVTTVPEVTDSGVFEFGPAPAVNINSADNNTADNAVSAVSDEPAVEIVETVTTVTEVTDSGVFEFGPAVNTNSPDINSTDNNTDNAISAVSDEPAVEIVETVTAVTEVTDSGVFEFGPAVNTDNADNAISAASGEPAVEIVETVTTVTEVADSGVFELGPAVNADKVETVTTVTEVTDSGVFELGPPSAATAQPQDSRNGGDEWEIGWEPQDDGTAAEFDVSGDSAAAGRETPPPVFTKIAHVCLYVKDLGRSVEFYSKLGFQKRFVFNRNGSLFGVYLEFGGGNFIELFEDVSRSSEAALGRLAHFCLETPDIDAAAESLSARGVEFTPKKLGCDSTYQIWLRDPDGNEFEIHQYTENSSQIIGGEVEADW